MHKLTTFFQMLSEMVPVDNQQDQEEREVDKEMAMKMMLQHG